MKILKYRTIAEIYPFLSLEAMVKLDNGDIVYTNISVNDEGKQITSYEDNNWTYKNSLTEISGKEDIEDYIYDLSREDEKDICDALLELWNSNPIFDNDCGWKEYEKK